MQIRKPSHTSDFHPNFLWIRLRVVLHLSHHTTQDIVNDFRRLEKLGHIWIEPDKILKRQFTIFASALPNERDADIAVFWSGGELPDDFFGEVRLPPVSAALPRRLGAFPFWRGSEHFLDAIEPVYENASPRGLDIFLGESESKHRPEPEPHIARARKNWRRPEIA
jgi:hypothetical protein